MGKRQHSTAGTRTLAKPAWANFVGRERELEELGAALSAARSGHGEFVLVAGEPGIGKTALVSVLAQQAAAEGVRVVWGRCWEGGGAPPFWPWGRIVDELCHERDAEWLHQQLGGGAERLGLMAPDLNERLGGPSPSPPESEQARFVMLNSLAEFLRAVTVDEPLLLVLDDVNAAGADALLALEFVSRELREAPLLGIATYREEDIQLRPEMKSVMGGLARTCRRINLAGLPEADLALMLERMTGSAPAHDLVRAVSVLAAGNPFFAGEVVRTLTEEGELDVEAGLPAVRLPLPSGVRDAITRRILALPDAAQQVLAVAAVIGHDIRLAIVQRAAGIGRRESLEALDHAVVAGLIVPRSPGGTTFEFAHGLVRETIYAGLGTVERSHLHAAVGDALEQVYEGDLETHLPELAHHFFEAAVSGDPDKAVAYLTRAGRRALGALAWDEAARLFQEALEALDLGDPDPNLRAELLVELGRGEVHAGSEGARETLRTAAACATAVERPDLLARAALDFGAFALSPGIVDEELVSLLDEALAALESSDSPLRVRLLARLGVALYWSPQVERRLAVTDEAVAMARRLGDRATLAYALANQQGASSSPDRTEHCIQIAHELFRLSDSRRELEFELPARVRQIGYLLELDDLAGADVALATLERLAADSHDPRAQAYVPLERSRRIALEGSFDEAEALTSEAGRLGAQLHDSTIPMQTAAQIIGMRWAQGRMGEMYQQLKRFADGYPAMPVFRAAVSLACCETGRDAEARRHFRLLADRDFASIPRDSVWLLAMAFLSETCAHLEEADAAAVLYGLFAPFEGRNVTSPDAIFAGPVSRYLGLLATAQGDFETAERHFTAAWEQASLDSARPAMLRTRLDHARMLLGQGGEADRARAIQLLDEAHSLAQELDLSAVLEWVEAAREARGDAPPRAVEPVAAGMHREGEVWRFDYGGRAIHVRDSKGMRNLAVLLEAPGVEIAALDVEARAGELGDHGVRVDASVAADADLVVRASPDTALAGLDETAKSEYRSRLQELREEIEQAEAWSDSERVALAREEMDAIGRELSAAVGLGGRDRPLASGAERARVRVTRTIHTAIRRIGDQDAELGYELSATVRTGSFSVYEPDPRRPVVWRIECG
jgi:tetratricopeptide (TPR) repeat protein